VWAKKQIKIKNKNRSGNKTKKEGKNEKKRIFCIQFATRRDIHEI
jgi:hypothetical protein